MEARFDKPARADGNEVAVLDRAALCCCGGSKNKPFCDGTHRTNGFTG
ncbi:MAG: CDGSH iron-sulfur domain-containing protein [Gaiellaceae bacterium]